MAILITGATGFVGLRLVSKLMESGHDLVLFEGDIAKEKDFENIDKKIDVVIHLAAKIGGRNKKRLKDVNVSGTLNVIDFCKKKKVERLIFLSSARVLSNSRNPYIDSKRTAEEKIVSSGLSYAILRPSLIYGKGDKKNISSIINLAKKIKIVPVFEFKMQPVYIDDLMEIILKEIESSENKKINIVGGEIISYKDLLNILRLNNVKFFAINLPAVFEIILKIFSIFYFFPMPYWQVKSLLKSEVFEDYKWMEDYKIEPTSFNEGIKNILNK